MRYSVTPRDSRFNETVFAWARHSKEQHDRIKKLEKLVSGLKLEIILLREGF